MPKFVLTSHRGNIIRSTDLRNKVLLVSFIFTTCSGSCPATTHRMSQIYDLLKSRNQLDGDRIRFISITLDPARDTPAALKDYVRLYDLAEANWDFLTGPPAEVTKTFKAFGMWAKPAAGGQLDHPSRIFLVDKAGAIREIYNLDFMRPAWVVEDIHSLLKQ